MFKTYRRPQNKEKFAKHKDFEVKPYVIFDSIDRFLMKYEIKIEAIASLSLVQEDAPMVRQASSLSNTRFSNRMKHDFL